MDSLFLIARHDMTNHRILLFRICPFPRVSVLTAMCSTAGSWGRPPRVSTLDAHPNSILEATKSNPKHLKAVLNQYRWISAVVTLLVGEVDPLQGMGVSSSRLSLGLYLLHTYPCVSFCGVLIHVCPFLQHSQDCHEDSERESQ